MRHVLILLLLLTVLVHCSVGQQPDSKRIKIGLLLLDNPKNDSTDLSALDGVRLAIKHLNLPVELIVRSCDGPWGVTSKQVVDFVYEDEVDAIITSVDGRNAHLAEQVATKTHKPMIATRATDPTLTQAFVPWFFRITPDDNLQARILKQEIFDKRELKRIALIYPGSYNGTSSSQVFKDMFDPTQRDNSKSISYDALTGNFAMVLDKLQRYNPDGILFFGKARFSTELIAKVNKAFQQIPLFANLEIIDNSSRLPSMPSRLSVPMPKAKLSKSFIDSFVKENKYQPGFVAGYAYDALNVLVDAIKTHGTDYEDLMKGIGETNRQGATGLLRFDTHGNRDSEVTIGKVEDLLLR